MMRGAQPAEPFAEDEEVARLGAARAAQAVSLVGDEEDVPIGATLQERVLLGALLLVATAWLAALAWIAIGDPSAPSLTPAVFAKGLATASSPLVLVGVALLLLLRTSRRETARFASMAAVVRAESIGLNTVLAIISRRLEQDRAALAETADRLTTLGDDTSRRIAEASVALARETAGLAEQARGLDEAATTARLDMGVLLADLPRAEAQARGLADMLKAAGLGAHEQAGSLEARIAALTQRARETEETAGGAAARLAAQLARIEGASDVGAARIEEAARRMDAAIDGTFGRAADGMERTREGITAQSEAILTMAEQAGAAMAPARAEAAALAAAIADADRAAAMLTEGAAPRLVEALTRVRETAIQAADRAREVLAHVIPASASSLAEKSRAALADAVTTEVEAQIARMARCAEEALAAASRASEGLAGRVARIAETSGTLSAHVAQAEKADTDSFARRAALLIEALNSAAIDITRALSADIADPAWAEYLKGDRSVFTRRAIRLLDAGEAREVMRRYEEDAGFRDQVSRYIHDFEALLRPVLAARDGATMGVTLLSSDMGKLYVALAQAIERLRA